MPRPPASHHASHANYPNERQGPLVQVVYPAGRCALCAKSTDPCWACKDLSARCPGCHLLKCNQSTIHCPDFPAVPRHG